MGRIRGPRHGRGGRKGRPGDFEKSSHALKASEIKIKSGRHRRPLDIHPLLSSSPLLDSRVLGTRYVFQPTSVFLPRGGGGRRRSGGDFSLIIKRR